MPRRSRHAARSSGVSLSTRDRYGLIATTDDEVGVLQCISPEAFKGERQALVDVLLGLRDDLRLRQQAVSQVARVGADKPPGLFPEVDDIRAEFAKDVGEMRVMVQVELSRPGPRPPDVRDDGLKGG
jgi:hypothetical protein